MFVALIVYPFFPPTDSDYENANRSADVDVELMAFQSIIGDDYKGRDLFETLADNDKKKKRHRHIKIQKNLTLNE